MRYYSRRCTQFAKLIVQKPRSPLVKRKLRLEAISFHPPAAASLSLFLSLHFPSPAPALFLLGKNDGSLVLIVHYSPRNFIKDIPHNKPTDFSSFSLLSRELEPRAPRKFQLDKTALYISLCRRIKGTCILFGATSLLISLYER